MFHFSLRFILSLFTIIFICSIGLLFSLQSIVNIDISDCINTSSSKFTWPVPNSSTITSYYGYRKSPTKYASSFHKGIDIAAPSGSNIYSAFSGEVIYVGFYGANGYSLQIQNGDYIATYSHISPYYLVYIGQYIKQGELIATVGPKNVYDVPNNPYKDSSGNPTNGATTGPHLHFTLKIDGKYVNPLGYISSSSS